MLQTSLSYRPDIDGLRAFAVLAVIAYHFFPSWVKGGFVGVDIFFVISGFLIGGILIDSLQAGTFSFRDFYVRRIRRIFPALILVMASALAFGWFALLPDDYMNLGKHTAGGATFLSNFLLWRETGYFDVAAERKPLLHLWSLGIEEQFYIVLPLFLWGLWIKKRRILTCLTLFLLASFLANLAVYRTWEAFDFYMPFTRFWELLAGSFVAFLCRQDAAAFFKRTPENDGQPLRHCLSILGFLIVSIAVFGLGIARFPGINAAYPVLGAVCLIMAGSCRIERAGWINRVLLAWKPATAIGLISYPLYLWHWPLFSYARIILGKIPHWDFRIGLVLLSFVLAALTYFFIERPIRFGKRLGTAKTAGLILLLLAVGIAGGAVYYRKGLENRSAVEKNRALVEEFKNVWEFDDLQARNEACKKKFEIKSMCLYNGVSGAKTILLFGDSHALVSFDAIAEFNARLGVNTLLLHSTPEPPIIRGSLNEHLSAFDRLLNVLSPDFYSTISKVFIIERGVLRVERKDIDQADFAKEFFAAWAPYGAGVFRQRLQYFTDRFKKEGKEVFIVAENPVWSVEIRNILPIQPFRPLQEYQPLYKSEVLKHQETYLNALKTIKGATIIYTIGTWCPGETCLLTDDDDLPLYSDKNHLSKGMGSRFLAERILKPYLEK